jgi:hypothetical protein
MAPVAAADPGGTINLMALFPAGLANHGIRYVFHMSHVWVEGSFFPNMLIEMEGIENVEDLAHYTDSEIDLMADCNSKQMPVATRVQMGLTRTKALEAIAHWVRKKAREGTTCDLRELTPDLIIELIADVNAKAGKKDVNSKLFYPDTFTSNKNWIKKVGC